MDNFGGNRYELLFQEDDAAIIISKENNALPAIQSKKDILNGKMKNRKVRFRIGKRVFDRQSGSDKTGIKSVDKRYGSGAHNWGSIKQDIEDGNKLTIENYSGVLNENEYSDDQSAEQGTILEEKDVKLMTLDEYKATKQHRIKPQFNLRKAGEGEDISKWKKMTILKKNKEDVEEEFEFDSSMYPQRVGRLQRIVSIKINYKDGHRGFGRGHSRVNSNDRARSDGFKSTTFDTKKHDKIREAELKMHK